MQLEHWAYRWSVDYARAEGRDVVGLARTRARVQVLEALGAQAVVGDALDANSVRAAVVSSSPDVVVHVLTAMPRRGPLRAADLEATNGLRRNGTRNLLNAAVAAGAAAATAAAVSTAEPSGIWNIVDDEPLDSVTSLNISRAY